MQAERWRRIDEIFHSALQVEKSRRAAFLDETCSGDESLRLELERLLARHEGAGSFPESPALDVAAEAPSPAGRLSSGSGHSVVVSPGGQSLCPPQVLCHAAGVG